MASRQINTADAVTASVETSQLGIFYYFLQYLSIASSGLQSLQTNRGRVQCLSDVLVLF